MPQINLLAQPAKKKKEIAVKPTFASDSKADISDVKPVLIFRCSICLGIIFLIWLPLFINIFLKEGRLKKLTQEVGSLSTSPEEMDKIKKEKVGLEKKIALITELSSRDFLWHRKLDLLADLIPSGIWLTDIYTKKEAGSSRLNPKTGGTTEKVFLVVRGTAVASRIEDAVLLVKNFVENVKSNKEFSKDFAEITSSNIAKSTFGGLDVMRFDLLCEAVR
ncbi:MAG TPA: hypothetical protein PL155_05805 [Candidatus Omnitrophota bacterium]|nr:hypothetical protein [Candidatus Omnitrophota bacterium]HPD84006.1 hypothetical protein [Candidatus Omnitrophota bacterium]HRZ02863.1 hypothetical protein [Candidatus Omnitrophota bacterium]